MNEAQFYENADRIDQAIRLGSESLSTEGGVLELLGDPSLRRYFFDHLKSSEWLLPLKALGFFSDPTPPEHIEGETATIRHPFWSESRYLVRMAGRDPFSVFHVSLQIPDTQNISVWTDLIEIALKLPAAFSAIWVTEKGTSWLKRQRGLSALVPDKLGALVEHLARDKQSAVALELARDLLAVFPDPRREEKSQKLFRGLDPVARINTWDYEVILKKRLPALLDTSEHDTLRLLCELLAETLDLSRTADESKDDYSEIWRREIESGHQTGRDDIKGLLVTAVRDASTKIVSGRPEMTVEVVKMLEAYSWPVFERLALYVLQFADDSGFELASERLTRKDLFQKRGFWHEYGALARKWFGRLAIKDQNVILGWIEEGPDVQKFREGFKSWEGEEPSERAVVRHVRFWARKHLEPLKDYLSGEWKSRYQELAVEVRADKEELDHATPAIEVRTGLSSPQTADDLKALSLDQLVSLLNTWSEPVQSDEAFPPTVYGLAGQVSALVASTPETYAREAERFKGIPLVYVNSYLSGLRTAAKGNRAFDWRPVIDLCNWLLDQTYEQPTNDNDSVSAGVQSGIVELVNAGLEKDSTQIPFDLRGATWRVLQILSENPDPSISEDAAEEPKGMDPVTASLNTIRGRAMHAVLRYALWLKGNLEKAEAKGEHNWLATMPEVQEVLQRHLNPERDSSPVIRSIYGQWFPWLMNLDSEWSEANVGNIFSGYEPLGAAAWNAYITYTPAYNNVFEVLRGEYQHAVERLGVSESAKPTVNDPDEKLAEHLILFYGRGQLNLHDELVKTFYARASDFLRAHAMWFIGESLRESKEVIPDEVNQRFKALCELRIEEAYRLTDVPHAREMIAFGGVFASIRTDGLWKMKQLKRSLDIGKWSEPDHLVVDTLADVASDAPNLAVDCLNLIIEGDKEGWGINYWGDKVQRILEIARYSNDEKTRNSAKLLVNKLGVKGYLQFRPLVSLEYAWKKFLQAVLILAEGEQPLLQRLVVAYESSLTTVSTDDLPAALRERFSLLGRQLADLSQNQSDEPSRIPTNTLAAAIVDLFDGIATERAFQNY